MARRIIKLSTIRAGITIPGKMLYKHDLKIGDEVKVTLKANGSGAKIIIEYDPFVAKYGQALKNLGEGTKTDLT